MNPADLPARLQALIPPDDVHEVSRFLLSKCPVAHSEEDGEFWVVSRHADLLALMQDQERFSSGNYGVRVPHIPVKQPPKPPLDTNPPLHRHVRRVMNPYLSPQALAEHEDGLREVIADLIDAFVNDGHCDISQQFAKHFPSIITSREFFGVTDPDEVDQLRVWVQTLAYDMHREDPAVLTNIQDDWTAWCQELVDARRATPTDDIVSALIHAKNEDGGDLLTKEEVVGAIQILTQGGFSTTADATGNIVIRLIEDKELEHTLRERPELIPAAIEEIMRLDPPVTARPRRATQDVEFGGELIKENDRVLCNYLAANIDPDEWDDPEEFIIDRTRNRIMTFGCGPHRCIGSNMARLSLKIMVEELLARITDIRYADPDVRESRVSYSPSSWRSVDRLPITFTALPRS